VLVKKKQTMWLSFIGCIRLRYESIFREQCLLIRIIDQGKHLPILNGFTLKHCSSTKLRQNTSYSCLLYNVPTIDFCIRLSIHWVLLSESGIVINSLTCTWIYFLTFNLTTRHIGNCLRVTDVKYVTLMMSLGRWYLTEEQLMTGVRLLFCEFYNTVLNV